MQPISQNNPNIHKGPSRSADFNQMQNDMHRDLVQIFSIANANTNTIKSNMDFLIRENFFLQNKINKLMTSFEKIKADLLYKEQGVQRQQLIKSMYTLDNILALNGSTTSIDTMYGIATLKDSDRVVKTAYVNEVGDRIIPDSLQVTLLESNNTIPIDEATQMRQFQEVGGQDFSPLFDGSNNSFWTRKVSYPKDSNVSTVYGILHVKLPLNILNNIYTNTLTIHPAPEFSLTIADVWYKGYGETWYRLPNYPMKQGTVDSGEPMEIQDSGKLIFTFPRTEVTEVQIFFTQPYSFLNQNKREFVYGFQEIGVEYRVYNGSSAEFVTEFSIEGTGKRFYTIDKPSAIPSPGSPSDIDDLVSFKLYYDSGLTNEFDFGNEIMSPLQKIYIKTIINKQADVIPVLKEIKLNYVYKNVNDL